VTVALCLAYTARESAQHDATARSRCLQVSAARSHNAPLTCCDNALDPAPNTVALTRKKYASYTFRPYTHTLVASVMLTDWPSGYGTTVYTTEAYSADDTASHVTFTPTLPSPRSVTPTPRTFVGAGGGGAIAANVTFTLATPSPTAFHAHTHALQLWPPTRPPTVTPPDTCNAARSMAHDDPFAVSVTPTVYRYTADPPDDTGGRKRRVALLLDVRITVGYSGGPGTVPLLRDGYTTLDGSDGGP
jgi:hypothetical protein